MGVIEIIVPNQNITVIVPQRSTAARTTRSEGSLTVAGGTDRAVESAGGGGG